MIVLLHNIRSLHNVGSIFRTADAAGVAKIYLCGITPAPLDKFGKLRPQLAKVSLGAEKSVAWEYAKSTTRTMDKIKKQGFKIFAVEQSSKSVSYHALRLKSRALAEVALVLGNEVRGLPPSVLKKADKIVEIPMAGKKESLNVAVAFGVVVFSLRFGGAKILK